MFCAAGRLHLTCLRFVRACIFPLACGSPDRSETSAGQENPPSASVVLPDSIIAAAVSLPFNEFDQDMRGGWRALEQRREYRAAALLIERYATRREGLRSWQKTLLQFHAGQMYAYAGDTSLAIPRFAASLDTTSVGPGWAPYVEATIAFLRRDRAAFDRAAVALRLAPQPGGPDPNIRVVETLGVYFGRPYSEAYGAVRAR